MEQINQLIQEGLRTLIKPGVVRIQYLPYDIDVAMSVISRIRKSIEPEFQSTPEIDEFYKKLIQWFHADPSFTGPLDKGFIIQGPTGSGKTLAMQVMNIYRTIDDIKFIRDGRAYKMNFEICNVNDIVNFFIDNAFDGIQVYSNRYALCLDDIGSEVEQVKHYGNTLDVIGHILSERYSKRLLTFATTNYTTDMLEDKYGGRVISRMYALFNFVTLNGPDFRKPKAQ